MSKRYEIFVLDGVVGVLLTFDQEDVDLDILTQSLTYTLAYKLQIFIGIGMNLWMIQAFLIYLIAHDCLNNI